MKIVSWNCGGKFRDKFKKILELDADIYVIQECENPEKYGSEEYKQMMANSHWVGKYQYKGLAVFTTRPDIKLELLDWEGKDKRLFLPIRVNDKFTLLGVWACDPYIAEFYDYKALNEEHMTDDLIMIGDFNSSVLFDKVNKGKGKSHTIVVEQLREKGIEDIYHHLTGEKQGHEKCPTFFSAKHLEWPYHIDHCFSNPKNVSSMKIHTRYDWLNKSDHLPLEIETTL